PLYDYLAATSVGILDNQLLLDLNYAEDSNASVDMNLVMTGKGQIVEVQAKAEGMTLCQEELGKLMAISDDGIRQLIALQKKTLQHIDHRIGVTIGAQTDPGVKE